MERDLDGDPSGLSDAELRDEARKRGVPLVDELDREVLLDLLGVRERDREPEGPVARAVALIGKVVESVRAVLPGSQPPPRRPSQPPPRRSQPPPPRHGSGEERSGPESPQARSPIAETGESTARGSSGEPDDGGLAPEAARLLADPLFEGMRVIEAEGLSIVWRLGPLRVSAAQLIAPPSAELRFRVTRVHWPKDAREPSVRTIDHAGIRSEGALTIGGAKAGEKVVVAIGLAGRSAEGTAAELVSIEHAIIG